MTTTEMRDVIDRLRASRDRGRPAEWRNGSAAGEAWAKTKAEWDELDRVACESGLLELADLPDVDKLDSPRFFAGLVLGDTQPCAADVEAFWSDCSSGVPGFDFVLGFREGAVRVYDLAAGQL